MAVGLGALLSDLFGRKKIDYFENPNRWHTLLRSQLEALKFGNKEKQVLGLFYDETLKIRLEQVAPFEIYARLCTGKPPDSWNGIVLDASRALSNLEEIDYLIAPPANNFLLSRYVGDSGSKLYKLTGKGLHVLQSWHPPAGLRIRAAIAVMPPWAKGIISVAAAITAVQSAIQLGMKWGPKGITLIHSWLQR